MGGDQAPRLAVHQHTGAVCTIEKAVDPFRPREPFRPSSGGKQTRDGVAAQHGLVISVYKDRARGAGGIPSGAHVSVRLAQPAPPSISRTHVTEPGSLSPGA